MQQYATERTPSTSGNGNFQLWVGKVFGIRHSDLLIPNASLDTGIVHPGDLVNVFVGVNNQGDGPSTPTHVFVYLSPTSGAQAFDFQILKFDLRPLSPGERTAFFQIGYVPADIPPGQYYVQATVDPLNRVAEYSESNNSRLSTLTTITVASP